MSVGVTLSVPVGVTLSVPVGVALSSSDSSSCDWRYLSLTATCTVHESMGDGCDSLSVSVSGCNLHCPSMSVDVSCSLCHLVGVICTAPSLSVCVCVCVMCTSLMGSGSELLTVSFGGCDLHCDVTCHICGCSTHCQYVLACTVCESWWV